MKRIAVSILVLVLLGTVSLLPALAQTGLAPTLQVIFTVGQSENVAEKDNNLNGDDNRFVALQTVLQYMIELDRFLLTNQSTIDLSIAVVYFDDVNAEAVDFRGRTDSEWIHLSDYREIEMDELQNLIHGWLDNLSESDCAQTLPECGEGGGNYTQLNEVYHQLLDNRPRPDGTVAIIHIADGTPCSVNNVQELPDCDLPAGSGTVYDQMKEHIQEYVTSLRGIQRSASVGDVHTYMLGIHPFGGFAAIEKAWEIDGFVKSYEMNDLSNPKQQITSPERWLVPSLIGAITEEVNLLIANMTESDLVIAKLEQDGIKIDNDLNFEYSMPILTGAMSIFTAVPRQVEDNILRICEPEDQPAWTCPSNTVRRTGGSEQWSFINPYPGDWKISRPGSSNNLLDNDTAYIQITPVNLSVYIVPSVSFDQQSNINEDSTASQVYQYDEVRIIARADYPPDAPPFTVYPWNNTFTLTGEIRSTTLPTSVQPSVVLEPESDKYTGVIYPHQSGQYTIAVSAIDSRTSAPTEVKLTNLNLALTVVAIDYGSGVACTSNNPRPFETVSCNLTLRPNEVSNSDPNRFPGFEHIIWIGEWIEQSSGLTQPNVQMTTTGVSTEPAVTFTYQTPEIISGSYEFRLTGQLPDGHFVLQPGTLASDGQDKATDIVEVDVIETELIPSAGEIGIIASNQIIVEIPDVGDSTWVSSFTERIIWEINPPSNNCSLSTPQGPTTPSGGILSFVIDLSCADPGIYDLSYEIILERTDGSKFTVVEETNVKVEVK
jgi:hypothetical protein